MINAEMFPGIMCVILRINHLTPYRFSARVVSTTLELSDA